MTRPAGFRVDTAPPGAVPTGAGEQVVALPARRTEDLLALPPGRADHLLGLAAGAAGQPLGLGLRLLEDLGALLDDRAGPVHVGGQVLPEVVEQVEQDVAGHHARAAGHRHAAGVLDDAAQLVDGLVQPVDDLGHGTSSPALVGTAPGGAVSTRDLASSVTSQPPGGR